MHFYAWKNGLKTGMYYLRSRPAVDAIKFTLNVEELLKATEGGDNEKVIKLLNEQGQIDEGKEKESKSSATKDNKENKENKVNKMSKIDPSEEEGCISCSG